MTADARTAALAELKRAIAALAPSLKEPRDLQDLAELRRLALRLERVPTPALRDFDRSRFDNLIALAGPAMAGQLLSHLAEDLARCRADGLAGVQKHDWTALRASSHVLISLAGSVGALSLQRMAEALNAAAHLGTGDPAQAFSPDLLSELDALIALVRATPVTAGGTA